MDQALDGPGAAYRLLLRVHTAEGARRGQALAETGRGTPLPGAADESPGYFVALPGLLSLTLQPGAEGLAARELKLIAPRPLVLLAVVTALPAAPDWLPASAEYVLFEGDAEAARRNSLIYMPLRRQSGTGAVGDRIPVDRLIHALGYAIARANARLATLPSPGGVGLATSMNVRVGVRAFRLGPGDQVLVTVTRGDEAAEQFLEVSLHAVPDAAATGLSGPNSESG